MTDYLARGAEVVFLCTDKDAVKIFELESYMSRELRERFLRLPIRVHFKSHGEEDLRALVMNHIAQFTSEQAQKEEHKGNEEKE